MSSVLIITMKQSELRNELVNIWSITVALDLETPVSCLILKDNI